MIPNSIRLKNVFQYDDFTMEYMTGITGILGTNGKGKSNFLDPAHFFGFTGNTPTGMNKLDMLQWGATTGFTEVNFSHNSLKYLLRRNVHNAGVSLTWNDGTEQELTKLAEVNEYVMECLGMSVEVFRESCFVPQGKFLDIIDARHSDRMAYFSKIAGTVKAESLRSLTQGAINNLPTYPDRIEEIKTLKTELGASDVKAVTKKVDDLQEKRAEQQKCLADLGDIFTQPTVAERDTKLTAVQETLEAVTALKESYVAKNSLEIGKEPLKPTEDEFVKKAMLADWERLTKELAQVVSSRELLQSRSTEVPPEPDLVEADTMLNWLTENNSKYTLATIGVCPTCNTKACDIVGLDKDALIKEYEEKEITQKELRDKRTAEYVIYSQAIRAQGETQIEVDRKLEREAELTRQIAPLQLQTEGFDRDAFNLKEKVYNEYVNVLTRRSEKMNIIRKYDEDITKAKLEVQKVEAMKPVDPAEYERAKEIVSQCTVLQEQMEESKILLERLKTTVKIKSEQLVKYEEEQAKAGKVNKLRGMFERARDVLHRENLPKVIMRRLLFVLNSKLWYYLEQFDTEFTAYLNDDFDFICDYSTGAKDKPAKSLSGGQKVALALAFRFALSDILGAAVPLLILDEPTVFLDKGNMEAVRNVLYKARAHTEKGSYVLIATHKDELSVAFSNVINVGE